MNEQSLLPAPSPTAEKAIGVVFVHGIGSQAKSATLSSWGEPVVATLRRWVDEHNSKPVSPQSGPKSSAVQVEITNASLTAGDCPQATVTVPAHSRSRDGAPDRDATTIYMTEAWWSESFLPQSSTAVLGWGFKTTGRAVARPLVHICRIAKYSATGQVQYWKNLLNAEPRKHWQRLPWKAGLALYFVGAVCCLPCVLAVAIASVPLVIIALLAAMIGVIVVLGGAQVPGISRYLLPAANALVASLGDASVWTTQPLAAAAMRTDVATAIARAGKDDRKVVVVAHSQGAAICADLLFGELPSKKTKRVHVDALVTVGGATSLLAQPGRNVIENWADNTPETVWVNIWALWDPVPSGPVGQGRKGSDRRRWRACLRGGLQLAKAYRDIDYRKLNSPPMSVENADEKDREVGREEWPVYNTSLLATDHTTYQRNIVEVVEPLCELIFDVAADPRISGRHDLATQGPEPTRLGWFGSYNQATSESYAYTKDRLRRIERHIVNVRMVAATRIAAIVVALVYLPWFIDRLQHTSWFSSVSGALADAVSKSVKDKSPLPLLTVWFEKWISFETLARLCTYVLWVVVVYLVAVTAQKAFLRWSESDIIRKEVQVPNNAGQKVAGGMLVALIAITIWGLSQEPWIAITERWLPGWAVITIAAFGGLTFYLQILWGVRVHRAPADRKKVT